MYGPISFWNYFFLFLLKWFYYHCVHFTVSLPFPSKTHHYATRQMLCLFQSSEAFTQKIHPITAFSGQPTQGLMTAIFCSLIWWLVLSPAWLICDDLGRESLWRLCRLGWFVGMFSGMVLITSTEVGRSDCCGWYPSLGFSTVEEGREHAEA